MHIANTTDIPRWKVLVERRRTFKHCMSLRNFRNIPWRYISIKGSSATEHLLHLGDFTYIPRWKILVERTIISKHHGHVCDITDVPRWDIPIKVRLEHSWHICSVTHIPIINIARRRSIHIPGKISYLACEHIVGTISECVRVAIWPLNCVASIFCCL